MSRISKIEVITGMSKLTDLIQQLSKVGVRGVTVMQVLGCGVEMGTQEYEVEIEKIHLSSEDNKGMEIHVTDPKLLQTAGGIVQGMSGAPLLQKGKCIGAVTHVFVRDSTRGYATFLENML